MPKSEAKTCWKCGTPRHPKRPRREDFTSSVQFANAAAIWLDYTIPERAGYRARVVAWEKLRAEEQHVGVTARLRELFNIEGDLTDEQAAEGAELFQQYMDHRRAQRQKAKKR